MNRKLQLLRFSLLLITSILTTNVFAQWTQFGGDIEGATGSAERFGRAVTLSADGNTMAIGAFRDGDSYDDTAALDQKGAVRIYIKDSENQWIESAEILGPEIGENFGRSLSLSGDGNTLAVGSPTHGDGEIQESTFGEFTFYDIVTSSKGEVKVYRKDELGNWNKIGENINGVDEYQYLGYDLDLSDDGNSLAIGSYGKDFGTGMVSVYNLTDNIWVKEIDINGIESNENFGRSLRFSGDAQHIIVGAPAHDSNKGTARIYSKNSDNWVQVGSDIDGLVSFDYAGFSVGISLDGLTVAVGAFGHEYNSAIYSSAGTVKIYNYESNDWSLSQQIDGDVNEGEQFGYFLYLTPDANTIAIGGNSYDFNNGVTRVYENNNDLWTQKGDDIYSDTSYDGVHYSGTALGLSDDGKYLISGLYAYNSNDGLVKTYEFIEEDDTTLSLNENTIENLSFSVVDNSIQLNNDSIELAAIYDITGKSVTNYNLSGIYIVVFEEVISGKQQAEKIFVY